MGKKGKMGLILPKNSGDISVFNKAISILHESGGALSTNDFIGKLGIFLGQDDKGTNITSLYHKTDMPRYFGLLTMRDGRLFLSEWGVAYAEATTPEGRTQALFDAMASVSFGRGNEAVSSDSDVEAPLVFLKMLKDFGKVSVLELGIMLYRLEKGDTYASVVKRIRSLSEEEKDKEKRDIIAAGGGKLFDPKFHLTFEGLGVIKKEKQEYSLVSAIAERYGDFIDDLTIQSGKEKLEIEYKASVRDADKMLPLISAALFKKQSMISPSIKKMRQKNSQRAPSVGKYCRNKAVRVLTEEQCNQIGWLGEKYIFDLINKKNPAFLKELSVSQDETILEATWFNNGFEAKDDWIDQSVGKGCDIYVKTNKKDLFIEAKTSLNDVGFFAATSNEIKAMKELGGHYFIVKLNKLKNINKEHGSPEIVVINNPISLLEKVEYIKDITFYC